MGSLTRTIRRNIIRHNLQKEGRRHFNRTRLQDQYGNKIPSIFASVYRKIFGHKPGKVQRLRQARSRNN